MKVLGIDPGTEVMGYGLVEQRGSSVRMLETGILRARGEIGARLSTLHTQLEALIARAAPDEVAMEEVFHGRNVKTAIRLGQAQATLMLAAAGRSLEVNCYPPATVKKAVVGNGRAAKEQVQLMVKRLLRLRAEQLAELRLDATDALAVALTHLQHASRRKLQAALGRR